MRDFLVKRPMLLSAVFSCVVSVLGFRFEKVIFIICVTVLTLGFLMVFTKANAKMVFCCVMALLISVSLYFHNYRINQTVCYADTVCSGEYILIEEPVDYGDYCLTTVETVKSDILRKGSKIQITYNSNNLEFARHFKADLHLKSLEGSKYLTDNYSKNIYIKGYANNIEPLDKYDFVLKTVGDLRGYIKTKILNGFQIREASTMLALLTGDKSYFTDEFFENVKFSGVAHVMVVSGMHLAVIVSLFLYVCDKFFYNRFLKAFIIFIAVVIMSAVCGFTMSIMRAGITYILIAVSLLLNRQNTPENTLGAAVTLIMFCNPLAIFSISFQLSVLSTFGILVIAIPIIDYIRRKEIIRSKIVLSVFSTVLISLSALLLTMPVTIYNFGYISNMSIITNLLISGAVTFVIVLCILGLIFPFVSEIFFFVSGLAVRYINFVINYFGGLPFAITKLPQYVSFLTVGLVIIVFWILLACKRRNNMIKLKEIERKRIKEGGGKEIKWQSQTKKF